MKRVNLVIIILSSLFLLLCGCDFLTGAGNIEIQLYTTYYEENPEELTEDMGLYSVIQIPELDPEYYIGDGKGLISVTDIPKGNYTIHPLFVSSQYDIEITVKAGQTVSETIIIPDYQIEFYMINPSNITDVNFRKALATSINRNTALNNIGSDKSPLYNMLPSGLYNDGLAETALIIESTDVLSGSSNTSFTLTYNDSSTVAEALASELKSQWEPYGDIGIITLNPISWQEIFDRINNLNFDVIRMGWAMDSNNPFTFFKYIFDSVGYTSGEYTTILNALEQAQTDSSNGRDYISLADFITYTNQLHSLLIDEGLAIPLYE